MNPPSEIQRIQDQVRRAFDGGAWYGASLWELLAGVTARSAAATPVAGAHSIWELVLHAAAWRRVVCRWLAGQAAEVFPEDNWPALPDTSEAAWAHALEALRATQEELLSALSGLHDSRLNDPAPGRDFSIYFVLHGIVQHDVYHAGQIAVLKKALAA